MNRTAKITLILGGYVAAFLVACAAVSIRYMLTQGPIAQASSGMYAFGDALFFFGVLGFLSIFPTALALFFLRPYSKIWTRFSILCLAFASTALFAEIANTTFRVVGLYQSYWGFIGFLTLMRVFGTPLFALDFIACILIAPDKHSRRLLLIAAGIEIAVGAYAFIHLLFWQHFA